MFRYLHKNKLNIVFKNENFDLGCALRCHSSSSKITLHSLISTKDTNADLSL